MQGEKIRGLEMSVVPQLFYCLADCTIMNSQVIRNLFYTVAIFYMGGKHPFIYFIFFILNHRQKQAVMKSATFFSQYFYLQHGSLFQ